jgi:hypothetical protein
VKQNCFAKSAIRKETDQIAHDENESLEKYAIAKSFMNCTAAGQDVFGSPRSVSDYRHHSN